MFKSLKQYFVLNDVTVEVIISNVISNYTTGVVISNNNC